MGRKPKKTAKNNKRKQKKRRRPRRTLKPTPSVTRVDEEKLKALIERSKEGALSEDEAAELNAVVETLAYLTRELDEKNLTLRRLRALFGIPTSEKLSSVLPKEQEQDQDGEQAGEPGADDTSTDDAAQEKPPPKGHGRTTVGPIQPVEFVSALTRQATSPARAAAIKTGIKPHRVCNMSETAHEHREQTIPTVRNCGSNSAQEVKPEATSAPAK